MRKWPNPLSGLTKADHCRCDAVRVLELRCTRAYAAAAAARAADVARAADAAYAARAAAAVRTATAAAWAVAAYAGSADIAAVTNDYQTLMNGNSFEGAPLWPNNSVPKQVETVIGEFFKVLNELGMETIVSRYKRLLEGKESVEEIYAPVIEAVRAERQDEQKPEDTEAKPSQYNKKPSFRVEQKQSMRPETAATEDRLGREKLAEALTGILNASDSNQEEGFRLCLGLLGDWGSGKSTVIELLKKQLEKDIQGKDAKEWVTAEFNAWEYEQCDNSQAGIAQVCSEALTENMSWWRKRQLTELFALGFYPWRYLGIGCLMALLVSALMILGVDYLWDLSWVTVDKKNGLVFGGSLGAVIAGLAVAGKLMNGFARLPLAKNFDTYFRLPEFGKKLGEIPIMKRHITRLCELCLGTIQINEKTPWGLRLWPFSWFLRRFLPKPKKRLLYVVDDLDRCGHEGILRTFEAIRLVMDQPNVVVLIAVDQHVALPALACHYETLTTYHNKKTPVSIARDYLGKIIQLPVVLTPPDHESVSNFAEFLFGKTWQDSPDKKEAGQAEATKQSSPESSQAKTKRAAVSQDSELNQNSAAGSGQTSDKGLDKGQSGKGTPSGTEGKAQTSAKQVTGYWARELDCFNDLARKLDIHNPRQLKRLHDGYSLMTRYYGIANDSEAYQQKFEDDYRDKMAMLFLLERLHVEQKLSHSRALTEPYWSELREGREHGSRQMLEPMVKLTGMKKETDYFVGLDAGKLATLYRKVSPFVLPGLGEQEIAG